MPHSRVYISKNQYRKFVLFYRSECVFSNFYPAEFSAQILKKYSANSRVLKFNCSEQFFMYHKALCAQDFEIAEKILEEQDPKEQKMLGRRLEMSQEQLKMWSETSRDVMYNACLAKFSQNETCRKMLFSTHGMKLVEASPTDKIWGIGLDKMDKRSEDERTWKGTNWLGETLDKVREELWKRDEFKNEREQIEKESLETRVRLLEKFPNF